jgi:hypothetical protein
MPFTTNLPPENTNPWYTDIVAAWSALTTFVNNLETSLAAKVNSSTYTSGMAAKADNASVVHLAGAETISGVKTFSGGINVPDNSLAIADVAGLASALAGGGGGSGDDFVRREYPIGSGLYPPRGVADEREVRWLGALQPSIALSTDPVDWATESVAMDGWDVFDRIYP